jgi:hypothetical protein
MLAFLAAGPSVRRGIRNQESGGRRQEAGDRRQETGRVMKTQNVRRRR